MVKKFIRLKLKCRDYEDEKLIEKYKMYIKKKKLHKYLQRLVDVQY